MDHATKRRRTLPRSLHRILTSLQAEAIAEGANTLRLVEVADAATLAWYRNDIESAWMAALNDAEKAAFARVAAAKQAKTHPTKEDAATVAKVKTRFRAHWKAVLDHSKAAAKKQATALQVAQEAATAAAQQTAAAAATAAYVDGSHAQWTHKGATVRLYTDRVQSTRHVARHIASAAIGAGTGALEWAYLLGAFNSSTYAITMQRGDSLDFLMAFHLEAPPRHGAPRRLHVSIIASAPLARGTAAAAFNFCGQIARGIDVIVYLEALPGAVGAYQVHGLVLSALSVGEYPAADLLAMVGDAETIVQRTAGEALMLPPEWVAIMIPLCQAEIARGELLTTEARRHVHHLTEAAAADMCREIHGSEWELLLRAINTTRKLYKQFPSNGGVQPALKGLMGLAEACPVLAVAPLSNSASAALDVFSDEQRKLGRRRLTAAEKELVEEKTLKVTLNVAGGSVESSIALSMVRRWKRDATFNESKEGRVVRVLAENPPKNKSELVAAMKEMLASVDEDYKMKRALLEKELAKLKSEPGSDSDVSMDGM